jgi:hypothetical protein
MPEPFGRVMVEALAAGTPHAVAAGYETVYRDAIDSRTEALHLGAHGGS